VSVNARFYLEKFKPAKEKFEYMMQQGLCKPFKRFWASSFSCRRKTAIGALVEIAAN